MQTIQEQINQAMASITAELLAETWQSIETHIVEIIAPVDVVIEANLSGVTGDNGGRESSLASAPLSSTGKGKEKAMSNNEKTVYINDSLLEMQWAGFDVLSGVERGPRTALVFNELTSVGAMVNDVGSLQPNDVPSPLSAIGLPWASPPGQPWSITGRRRGADDARDGVPAPMAFIEQFHVMTTVSNAGYIVCGGDHWQVRLREATLLQSMPWSLPGSVTAKHIGNAVPPSMVQAVVEGIMDGGRQ